MSHSTYFLLLLRKRERGGVRETERRGGGERNGGDERERGDERVEERERGRGGEGRKRERKLWAICLFGQN